MNEYPQELRFLLTQECTYNCYFCHGEGIQDKRLELLDVEDINFIFNTARLHLGFETTTLSGGEPLLREDIIEIAKRLHDNLCKVTITTNGLLLNEKIHIGSYVDRVNISIHSLDEKTYNRISGRKNVFYEVLSGLQNLRSRYPKLNIRINTTLIKDVNSDTKSINDLLLFANKLNASVKLIEMYPPTSKQFISVDEVEKILLRQNFVPLVSTTRKRNYYNGITEVRLTKISCSVIKEHSRQGTYCADNNDLFVASDGTIKPCRHNSFEVDILPETKNRDAEGVYKKILFAYSKLTNNCALA